MKKQKKQNGQNKQERTKSYTAPKIKPPKQHKIRNGFEKFFTQHDVMDMAVGIILGSALTNITKSLTANIINPVIGLTLGKIDFSNLAFTVGKDTFRVGALIDSILTFLIIMLVVYVIVRVFDKFTNYSDKKAPTETTLLTNILEELQVQNGERSATAGKLIKGAQQNRKRVQKRLETIHASQEASGSHNDN